MLKLVGICILLFTSILISRELVAQRRRRLALCEELLRFVCFLRLQIGCFLRPVPEVVADFHSDELTACGFLPLRDDGDLAFAFSSSVAPDIVGAGCAQVLTSLFSSLGSGYLDDEIRLIDAHTSQLGQIVELERVEAARQARLIRTLTASASLGLVILII